MCQIIGAFKVKLWCICILLLVESQLETDVKLSVDKLLSLEKEVGIFFLSSFPQRYLHSFQSV